MNKTVELLRVIFISFEFLWILGVFAFGFYFPHWLLSAGRVFLTADVPNILPVLGAPFAMLVAGYKLSGTILRPEGNRNVLMGWADYPRLRLRVSVGLTYSLIGAITVLVGWLVYKNTYYAVGTSIVLAGYGAAAISLASVAKARQDVADIVDGES